MKHSRICYGLREQYKHSLVHRTYKVNVPMEPI